MTYNGSIQILNNVNMPSNLLNNFVKFHQNKLTA